jgi:golgi-specific brefeldin A-resistance guanine nucleotide exchange factor 1
LLEVDALTPTQEEAVSENLKNMLLVMSNGGYLAPPDDDTTPEQEELWNETWKRINRFLPNFLAELFPEEVGKKRPSKDMPVREGKGKENEKAEPPTASAESEKSKEAAEGDESDEEEEKEKAG